MNKLYPNKLGQVKALCGEKKKKERNEERKKKRERRGEKFLQNLLQGFNEITPPKRLN